MVAGTRFHRLLAALESRIDRVVRQGRVASVIEPYGGYSGHDATVLRARVLAREPSDVSGPAGSRLANLGAMVGLFLTREVGGVGVVSGSARTTSDGEGYVLLRLPVLSGRPGWTTVPLALADSPGSEVAVPVLIVDSAAPAMVISDIDDTVMRTGAHSLLANLWTSLTGHAETREVFPDAVRLMERLTAAGCPVFWVSSSPWNLHGFLSRVFELNGLPRGPMFLRDLGVDETRFIKGTHGAHKGAAIDELMAAFPDLPAILMGDTGQADAQVYADAAERWPGRVRAAILHEPAPGLAADDHAAIGRLRAAGVEVWSGRDYDRADVAPARVSA